MIATTSENEEDVCKALAWPGEKPVAVSNDACFFVHEQNPKYIAYLFESEIFQQQKAPFVTGTKVLRVSPDNMAKIRIPIPPVEVQEDLTARRRQYAYYRDRLLDFPERTCA